MTNVEKVRNLHGIAMALAPCLRDKFDFSTDAQFTDWAKIAFKAAEAFLNEVTPKLDAAGKKDFEDQQNAVIEQERARRLAATPITPETVTLPGETK